MILWDESKGKPKWLGCMRSERLSFTRLGKAFRGKAKVKTGIGKSDLPGVCPGKAGVFSGRQTHRGKSQEPRSTDSGEEENRISEAYRQSHLQDGEQAIGP